MKLSRKYTASGQPAMASLPPELKPLSRAPINLHMSNDAKVVYETIGKLAGLTVIYDPDLQAKRIPVELNNVTLGAGARHHLAFKANHSGSR